MGVIIDPKEYGAGRELKSHKYDPIVISGPSGSGKNHFVAYAVSQDEIFHEAQGCTTRERREGETNEMFFLSVEEFEELIQNNQLIDFTIYDKNYYGTPLSEYDKLDDKRVIFNVTSDGGIVIKNDYRGTFLIYMLPPNREELLRRLGDRGQDRYTAGIKDVLNNASYYEYLLISSTQDLNKIYEDFLSVVDRKEDGKKKRMIEKSNSDFIKNFYSEGPGLN